MRAAFDNFPNESTTWASTGNKFLLRIFVFYLHHLELKLPLSGCIHVGDWPEII